MSEVLVEGNVSEIVEDAELLLAYELVVIPDDVRICELVLPRLLCEPLHCAYFPRIWKVLLRVRDVSAEAFLEYVGRGPCEVREKIRNDTFRLVLREHCILRVTNMVAEPSRQTEVSRSA